MSDEAPKPLKKISGSWLWRSSRSAATFLGVGARMGVGAMRRAVSGKDRAAELQAEQDRANAQSLLRTLGDMKGAVMKLGQMFSYMELALPESWNEVLRELQDSSHAMDPEAIAAIIKEELGAPPEEVFAEWTREPFAAASIGQVHRAVTKGGIPVAVKVQYPGIRAALTADLKNTRILGAMARFAPGAMDTAGNLAELRARLMEECDYTLEAKNQRHFTALWEKDPRVRIPEILDEHSTKHVLTSRFVEATRFYDFVEQASQEEKDAAGGLIHDVAFASIFHHGVFNCDPHPGNYLFGPDGEVVFLDFGCVKYFEPETVEDWRALIRATLERDHPRFREISIKLGMAPNPDKFDFGAHYRMYLYLLLPWLKAGPVRFTHDYVRASFKELIGDNPNKLQMNAPPQFFFVSRLQWGLYSVLALLDAEREWREQILDILYAPGEARPEPFTDEEIESA